MIILRHLKTLFLTAAGLSTILALNGCSISNGAGSASDSSGSFAKSSDSISGSSESSSKSSGNDSNSKTSRYENETLDFTATYLSSNINSTDQHTFMKGISEIAAQNGIVDWESHPKTYHAIGKGLKQVNLSASQYQAYKQQLSDGNSDKMAAIQQGYTY
jgi:hypothetical protein